MPTRFSGAGIAIAAVTLLWGLQSYNDYTSSEVPTPRHDQPARAAMAARGVCGSGGVLAYLSEGRACLYEGPGGRTFVEPLDVDPRPMLALH